MDRLAAAARLIAALGITALLVGACVSPPKPMGLVSGRLILIDQSTSLYQSDPATGGPGGLLYAGTAPANPAPPPQPVGPVPAGSTVTITPDAGGPAHRVRVGRDGMFSIQVPPGQYELGGSTPGFASPNSSCAGPGTITVKRFATMQVNVVCLHEGS